MAKDRPDTDLDRALEDLPPELLEEVGSVDPSVVTGSVATVQTEGVRPLTAEESTAAFTDADHLHECYRQGLTFPEWAAWQQELAEQSELEAQRLAREEELRIAEEMSARIREEEERAKSPKGKKKRKK